MSEKTTVAFRISESVKQEWDDAAESSEQYNSVSHLIRLAVQRELEGRTEPQTPAEAPANPEVQKSLRELEAAVRGIQDEVELLSRDSKADELYSIEQVLLEVLPSVDRDEDPYADPHISPSEALKGYPTAHDIAGRIGADTSVVRDTLEKLTENTSTVRTMSLGDGDEIYCWKVE